MDPLRIGLLGCAGVVQYALMEQLRSVPEARVVAVASRSADKAHAFAAAYGLAAAYGSYDELLADPEVELVYNPLPNSLHCEWTVRALQAGKPVLCEKPLASNAAEAQRMADAARASGQPLIEAMHYRHHPVAKRIEALVSSGVLGRLRRIETSFRVPAALVTPNNIRFEYDLAGGVGMDPGCYCVDLLRMIAGEEPSVLWAHARLLSPQVDIRMHAELQFPSGCTGNLQVALDYEGASLDVWLRVVGDEGEMTVINPFMPHTGHTIMVTRDGATQIEQLDRQSTYLLQLRHVVQVMRGHATVVTTPENGVAIMRVIDDIYRAAGLKIRGA